MPLSDLIPMISPNAVITPEQIAAVLNVPMDVATTKWALERLQVRAFVEREFYKKYGYHTYIKDEGHGLRIISADETEQNAQARMKKNMRDMRRTSRVMRTTASHANLTDNAMRSRLRDAAQTLDNTLNSTMRRVMRDHFSFDMDSKNETYPKGEENKTNDGDLQSPQ